MDWHNRIWLVVPVARDHVPVFLCFIWHKLDEEDVSVRVSDERTTAVIISRMMTTGDFKFSTGCSSVLKSPATGPSSFFLRVHSGTEAVTNMMCRSGVIRRGAVAPLWSTVHGVCEGCLHQYVVLTLFSLFACKTSIRWNKDWEGQGIGESNPLHTRQRMAARSRCIDQR